MGFQAQVQAPQNQVQMRPARTLCKQASGKPTKQAETLQLQSQEQGQLWTSIAQSELKSRTTQKKSVNLKRRET